jgi:Beige/BEACH domain
VRTADPPEQVLADYSSARLDLDDPASFRDLSKPMGALDATRLARARERFGHMPPGDGAASPFLFGTHYSSPAYTMFWLVRELPATLLRRAAHGAAPAKRRVACSQSGSHVQGVCGARTGREHAVLSKDRTECHSQRCLVSVKLVPSPPRACTSQGVGDLLFSAVLGSVQACIHDPMFN